MRSMVTAPLDGFTLTLTLTLPPAAAGQMRAGRLRAPGIDPSGMPGTELARIVAADIARWTAVAKAANIRADRADPYSS